MQIKSTIWDNCISGWLKKKKKTIIPSVRKDVMQPELSCSMAGWEGAWEVAYQILLGNSLA